jgi:hypothetical protein
MTRVLLPLALALAAAAAPPPRRPPAHRIAYLVEFAIVPLGQLGKRVAMFKWLQTIAAPHVPEDTLIIKNPSRTVDESCKQIIERGIALQCDLVTFKYAVLDPPQRAEVTLEFSEWDPVSEGIIEDPDVLPAGVWCGHDDRSPAWEACRRASEADLSEAFSTHRANPRRHPR